jgi:transglutaminase-like putative cysteine protease
VSLGRALDLEAADETGVGFRLPALAGIGLLTFSYVSVLYHVTDVVGGVFVLLALVAASLALATATARLVAPATAGAVAAVLLAGGFAVYVFSVPESQRALLFSGRIVSDTVALLTGLSVIRLTNAGVWAMAIAPGPVFLSWYLAVRGRYVAGVTVGGVALGLFVLTGDADVLTTLAGVVGATAAVGLGNLERHGGGPPQLDTLTAVLAAMVVVSATLSLVPAGAAGPLAPQSQSPTVESSLVEAQDSVDVLGSISLSPQVRFTVEADEGRYWQTAAYDRYTGGGWVRTGETRRYQGRLAGPPGSARTLRQQVTARTPLGSLPAAWRPVELDGAVVDDALATPQGGLRLGGAVSTGDSYTVTSRVPQHTEAQLRRAGTDYPDRIAGAYRQLPESTTDRVRERAAEVTGDAGSPYAKAVAVEEYLESEKRYSLQVERPEGAIADSFLFEMEAGYCTYYATTMVTMLRAEGVPARFVVGYTEGQETDGEYVVRGLDSHAWVQVYFPDVGWVNFDPTPAGPRRSAEQGRLSEARADGVSGIDTNGSEPTTPTPTPTPTAEDENGSAINVTEAEAQPGDIGVARTPPPDGGGDGGFQLPTLPSRRTLALWAVALAGALAVGRRLGLTDEAVAAVRLRYQGAPTEPGPDAVRAYYRLETLFGSQYRPRRPGETPREYVRAMVEAGADREALVAVEAYERARYGDGVDADRAAAAVAVADRLTWAATPVLRRFAS